LSDCAKIVPGFVVSVAWRFAVTSRPRASRRLRAFVRARPTSFGTLTFSTVGVVAGEEEVVMGVGELLDGCVFSSERR